MELWSWGHLWAMSSSFLPEPSQRWLLSVRVEQAQSVAGPRSCRLKQLATGPGKVVVWIQTPHLFNLNLLRGNQGIVCVHKKADFVRSGKENSLLHSPWISGHSLGLIEHLLLFRQWENIVTFIIVRLNLRLTSRITTKPFNPSGMCVCEFIQRREEKTWFGTQE